MSKTKRLIEMMIVVNIKKHFTVGELADEFMVSKRTILRDLQELERIGFPLYSEVGAAGGYYVLKERVLPPIAFSESEAKTIYFACQTLQFYHDLPFEEEMISVLNKFLNCLPLEVQASITQLRNKVSFWVPERHCASPLLKTMLDIIMSDQAVTIRYSSTHSESIRTIIPVGLYSMTGLWYCPAYCMSSNKIKEFRVDRIKEIIGRQSYAKRKYPIPDTIGEYLNKLEEGGGVHIKIKLTDTGVKRCESEFLLARGLKTIPAGGGIIDMKIRARTLEWVADYLLPLGADATVLAPIELKQKVIDKIRELHRHYAGDNSDTSLW